MKINFHSWLLISFYFVPALTLLLLSLFWRFYFCPHPEASSFVLVLTFLPLLLPDFFFYLCKHVPLHCNYYCNYYAGTKNNDSWNYFSNQQKDKDRKKKRNLYTYIGWDDNRSTIGQGAILYEKINRKYIDKIFSHDALFQRKSSLKICKVYFNLAKYQLGWINNSQKVIIHVKMSKKCKIKFFCLKTYQENKF